MIHSTPNVKQWTQHSKLFESIHNNSKSLKSVELFTSHFALLDSVKHFPLHAVLEFTSPQHQVEDFVDRMLRIFLEEKQN